LVGGVGEAPPPARLPAVDRLAGQPLPGVRDVGERRLAALVRRRAVLADDDAGVALSQRSRHDHTVGYQLADHPRRDVAAGDVRQVHLAGGVGAREVEARQLPDGAPPAVAAHQVAGRQLATAKRALPAGDDAVAGVYQAGELAAAAQDHAQLQGPALEDLLDLVLGRAAHSEVRAFEEPEVDRYAPEVPLLGDLGVFQPVEKPALMEDLGRARGESDTARLPAPFGPPLE